MGYKFVAPDTTLGRDLLENIRNGVITKSSFAFTVDDEEWEKDKSGDVRTIKKIKRLCDVAPVTYPAYNDTDVTAVAARNLEKVLQPEKEIANDIAMRDKDLRELDLNL